MATYRKKEASIVSITMFLALVAVTPKLLVASFIPAPVLAQQGAPASFPMPSSVTAPFKTGANAKQISQDSTIEVIKQLGKNGIGYAIADQVLDRKDVQIIRMHKVLPDNPRYPFSQTLTYVYKQSNPNPGIPLYLGFATDSSNQQTVKEAIANTTTAPAAPQPAPSKPAETAKPTDPGMSSALIKGGGETATSEVGFPWWLLLLLGIPLLGGLVWWLLKSGRPQAEPSVGAIPIADKPSTATKVVAPAPPPPSSRLFLVPYEGKNAYAYWEIAPAQMETLQRGGGELMLRLYDVTGIPRSERYSP